MEKTTDIWNQKIIQLMDEVITQKAFPEIDSRRKFLISIGFEPNNFSKVETGRSGFRIEHIIECSKKYNVNVYWLLGMEQKKYRK